ncbi:MAG: LuxR C-terminal-related transcriptional regulator [Pseudomonadota bacterium]
MKAENDTTRLTEREKDCLRRWLEHKTAKEIALELGVSHHAVEKRLKMARMKLGVSSSLEAARLLAQAEGCERKVAQSTDLPNVVPAKHGWTPHSIAIGVVAMFLCTALALVLYQQAAPDGDLAASASQTEAHRLIDEATVTRIAEVTQRTFEYLDTDGSGFLEQPESPSIQFAVFTSSALLDAEEQIERALEKTTSQDTVQLAEFYSEADRDGDGKVSYAEYHDWSAPRLAQLGIDPVNDLKPDG